ncbi:MAG TPA: hypothetical protein DCG19_02715 [Cryomorphaceae bacterium]|nr:hypothetical protein [Owenweeksia sp.]MBF99468.1 hypothetical protein [Owenweeksia sp.]HAD96287.1 hypothetical protein [Cryomorphaceae bacterium]HBF21869.1 hypothetical protein [Cryomorphaceae bacterium]|tara:strand:+ start:906 stop:1727 length:822 start_codon:yes stop_codon:yes gene_type:complete
MTKRTILYFTLLASAVLISFDAFTNSSGAPSGNTGSPKSGNQTCARSGCHAGGPSVGARTVSITTDIPATGFVANTNYTITVTANDGGLNNARIGFQTSVEGGGNHVGTLSTGGSNALIKTGSFIGHSFNGISPTGGVRTWTFTWNSGNAPDQSTIYTAVNFANGNGTTSGDAIATQTLVLNKESSVGIEEAQEVMNFSMAPNPARSWVSLEGIPSDIQEVKIMDLQGKVVKYLSNLEFLRGQAILSLEGLAPGNYLVAPIGSNIKPQQLLVE